MNKNVTFCHSLTSMAVDIFWSVTISCIKTVKNLLFCSVLTPENDWLQQPDDELLDQFWITINDMFSSSHAVFTSISDCFHWSTDTCCLSLDTAQAGPAPPLATSRVTRCRNEQLQSTVMLLSSSFTTAVTGLSLEKSMVHVLAQFRQQRGKCKHWNLMSVFHKPTTLTSRKTDEYCLVLFVSVNSD